MGVFKNFFTWWEGASTGTALFSWRNGVKVGGDDLGNAYFEARKGGRRWVIYSGSNDVSRLPPEWYAWLTRQIEAVPDEALPPAPKFLRAATPNLTGTAAAYLPAGALERGGRRAAATGDYQAWTPDGA
jgi:NADH:ubiquinone oxidoreductase subunit